MLKKLFYASASILMLALAYHLGASTAQGQGGGQPIALTGFNGDAIAMLTNGDIYYSNSNLTNGNGQWSYRGNLFTYPTPAAQPTWGQLKAQYRK